MGNVVFEDLVTKIIQTNKDRIEYELETLFMHVSSAGMNLWDESKATPLFRWRCDYNDYQDHLIKILNRRVFPFQETKSELLKAGGSAALTALSSKTKLEFMRILLSLTEMQINLDIRNASGNSPLGFACQNGQTEVVQLMLPFLSDKGLNRKNTAGITSRNFARIYGYKNIDYILTDELIQRGMEEPGTFTLLLDDYSPIETIIEPWGMKFVEEI